MENLADIVLAEGQLEGTSATLAVWLIKEGDLVRQGDPIAELETDKVVMEICAEATGRIKSLETEIGGQVEVGQVLGKIDRGLAGREQVELKHPKSSADHSSLVQSGDLDAAESDNDAEAVNFVSPAVRRLLRENGLEIGVVTGSGKGGRVTRDDVLHFLENTDISSTKASAKKTHLTTSIEGQVSEAVNTDTRPPKMYAADNTRVSRPLVGNRVPHSQMRKSIARHMVESLLNTSPHVTSVFEMNMTNIIEHRKWHKKEFQEQGVKLTFTAYFLAAMVKAVESVPQSNARFHEDALELFTDVNIGVGTALGNSGLVVPVVEQVQSMSLFEIAQALNLQTGKARDGKLTPSDMRNGTITISNHGVSGSLFATPIIINQPEVAILGVGKLEKRVIVQEINGQDTMVIKPMCYVSLSIDHRALDAHQTNQFLNVFVQTIENWGE